MMTFWSRLPSPRVPLLSPLFPSPFPPPMSLQIETYRLTFRANARARTDHGADIVSRPHISLAAPTRAPGSLALFPGLSTRPVSAWAPGSPLGSPSLLLCSSSPTHLLSRSSPGPAPCFGLAPSLRHCSVEEVGRGLGWLRLSWDLGEEN